MKVLNGTMMKTVGTLTTKVKVNSPTVLLVCGGICLAGAVISAHRAGRRVDDVLDMTKTQIDNLKDMRDAGEFEDEEAGTVEFTEDDYKKELTHTYISTSLEFVKLYGPVVIFTTGAIVCFVSGNRILAKRLAGMTAAYQIVQESYMKYRQNVTDDLGWEADAKYLKGKNGKFREKYYETKVDEKTGETVNVGKAKVREIDVVEDIKDWRQASPYAVRLDMVKGFTKDFQYNKMWLESIERIANGKLDYKGYLTLYEVYDALGVVPYLSPESTMMSHNVGWVKGYGDGDIRFGFVMVPTVCAVEDGEVGNLTEVGLIDFNCIGSIWDKLC